MVATSTIFRHYQTPFHRDDLTLLLHVLEGLPNVPSLFEFISYRNNQRRKQSIYFNKARPLMNSCNKRRLAAIFYIEQDYFEHSEIFSWPIAKYGKIIFNGLFQKKRVFQKTSSILLKVVP